MHPDTQVLRVLRWQIVFAALLSLAAGGALVVVIGRASSALAIAGCALLLVGALAAFAHTLTTRIALHPDGLVIVHNFRRRFLPREEIETVRWERSTGVSVKLIDGGSVKLPETGHESQLRANKIRAWLKQPTRAPGNARLHPPEKPRAKWSH